MLQTVFHIVFRQKLILTKKFVGVRNSTLVYDVIKKVKKLFFGKRWQETYQQTQMDPLSRNLLIVLVST